VTSSLASGQLGDAVLGASIALGLSLAAVSVVVVGLRFDGIKRYIGQHRKTKER
jgi:hypothetical protein